MLSTVFLLKALAPTVMDKAPQYALPFLATLLYVVCTQRAREEVDSDRRRKPTSHGFKGRDKSSYSACFSKIDHSFDFDSLEGETRPPHYTRLA